MEFHEERKNEIRWIPDGFHFRGSEAGSKRRSILNQVTGFFQKAGYAEVFLPAFDYSATFTNHLNYKNAVLKFRDFSGSEISPSSDPTIQAVKGIAGQELSAKTRIFYTSSVIRDNDNHNGRRRETLQTGAENFGSSGVEAVEYLFRKFSR